MSMVIGGPIGALGGSGGISLGGAGAAVLGAIVRAKLVPDPTSLGAAGLSARNALPVLFSFSPKDMTVERKISSTQLPRPSGPPGGVSAGNSPKRWRYSSPMKLTFTAYLEGELTKLNGDALLAWMNPANQLVMSTGSSAPRATLPKLFFQWGPPAAGFLVYCVLDSCKITYKRFSALGIPLRAEAAITIVEEPSIVNALNTNPTSGGRPGRQQHTVIDGENVVHVANQRYRDPRAWRDIASVNEVDDPLRVRPGSRVYLPAPDELTLGRGE